MENIIKNKVLNRHFFIKKGTATYCGKCGKKQLQDSFNLKKHAKECGFETGREPKVFMDGKDYAYAFHISKDGNKLYFYVLTYKLKLRAGFKDRYIGGEWEKVYTAIFQKGSREIKEHGLYNIDIWIKEMVDNKGIPCLSSDSNIGLFRHYFSDVVAYSSLGSFLDIYRNKGYGSEKKIPDSKASQLVENIMDDSILKLLQKQDAKCLMLHVFGSLIEYNDDLILNIKVETGNNYGISPGVVVASFLVSDKYAYTKNSMEDVRILLEHNPNGMKNCIPPDILHKFATRYPNFMINEYHGNNGKNILIPLLSQNYDKCMEILYKAGLTLFSDHIREVKRNNSLPLYKNNIKEIFGLPVKTMRRISSPDVMKEENIFERLSKIHMKNPRFLSMEEYNEPMVSFLKYQNVTHDKTFKYDFAHCCMPIDRWSDDEMFQTLKYLKAIGKNYHDVWTIYKDYIRLCGEIGEFIFGKYPKNLYEAHNIAIEVAFAKMQEEQDERFMHVVRQKEYKYFCTDSEDGKSVFEDDKYVIIAPTKSYDLVRESAQMSNCVKTYIKNVCDRKTMVFFLREKKNIEKSVCTIEVSPDMRLIQCKAYGNHIANMEIQSFVRKWVREKGLRIATHDIKGYH